MDEFLDLIVKFLINKLTPEEEIRLYQYVTTDSAKSDYFSSVKNQKALAHLDDSQLLEKVSIKEEFKIVSEKLNLSKKPELNNNQIRHLFTGFYKIAALITLILILGGSFLLFYNTSSSNLETQIAYHRDDAEIKLIDGTRVTLNYNSTLKLPDSYSSKNRLAQFEGEGYFEVIKDPENPFFLKMKDIGIKVTGTKFNLRSYPDEEQLQLTLIEGQVSIINNEKNEFFLQPNQQLSYNKTTSEIIIREVDTERFMEWKKGFYSFYSTPLNEIIQVLERSYSVEIVANEASTLDELFTGKFSKTLGITEILDILETSTGIEYTVK